MRVQAGSQQDVDVSLVRSCMVIVDEEQHSVRDSILPYLRFIRYCQLSVLFLFFHRPSCANLICNHHVATCRAMSGCSCTGGIEAWTLPIRGQVLSKVILNMRAGSKCTTEFPASRCSIGKNVAIVIDEPRQFLLFAVMSDEMNHLFVRIQQ